MPRGMITIKDKRTGEIKQVTKNEAFDLVERGLAVVYTKEYKTTAMQPGETKKYKIK